MKRIVIFSDCTDVAFNEMRATILAHLDKEKVGDVGVEPFCPAIVGLAKRDLNLK